MCSRMHELHDENISFVTSSQLLDIEKLGICKNAGAKFCHADAVLKSLT